MQEFQTILILDHGHCIDDRISADLHQAGCTVLDFDDGEDAWARALKTRIDCFVIDAELPYSDDGIYFIENIRAKSFYARTPIYAMFSEPMDSQHPSTRYRSYYRAGITASFLKDAELPMLLQRILNPPQEADTLSGPTEKPPSAVLQKEQTWKAILEWLDRAGQPDGWI